MMYDHHKESEPTVTTAAATVEIQGDGLTIADVVRVARNNAPVRLTRDATILKRIRDAHEWVLRAVDDNRSVYGVTTAFGGMANISVPREAAAALQDNIPWPHKTGAGPLLPDDHVRAAMLLRANSLTRGVSGVRPEIIRRLADCLNSGLTPHVHELGSIGASGDLVPLSYIAGAVIGLDPAFTVRLDGQSLDAVSALARLGLPRMGLAPKEGLAIINGTSVMSGIAALCTHDARILMGTTLGAHALMLQGLMASAQSFDPFINRHKPHPGQVWTADRMRDLLAKSRCVKRQNGGDGTPDCELEQDRYSLRCLPQFLGPMVDGLAMIARQVETEMNAATDNPLIDPETDQYYYCGNFLGQYIGMAMDRLRHYLGMMAKHLDTQIALLVAPEFNNGLSPSLTGNPERRVNLGLKGLQLTANAIMPLILFRGASLVDRFPTHAEQFNQNINSQGFGSANLARESVALYRQYLALSLMFGVQAADLRTQSLCGHYDARQCLSPSTAALYESVLGVVGRRPSPDRPYIRNDNEQSLDTHIRAIAEDIAAEGRIPASMEGVIASLGGHSPV